MPCPFETLNSATKSSLSFLNMSSKAHASAVAAHKAAAAAAAVSASHQVLSEHLKHATADAHRRVESSEGVRRLMGFTVALSSSQNEDAANFGRLDYIRWMIMLGCIYAALESALQSESAKDAAMLHPLFRAELPIAGSSSSSTTSSAKSSSSLLQHIYRYASIVDDVETHLRELAAGTGNAEGEGLSWQELVDSLDVTDGQVDIHARLVLNLNSLRPSSVSTSSITPGHLKLLTYSQAEATLVYVERIEAVARTQPDLLLSHAYVRYLGDLSGGQHIKRRIQKLFPVEGASTSTIAQDGYAFYSFAAPADYPQTEWHMDLKNTFRRAMDQGIDSTLAMHGVGADAGELTRLKLTQRLLELQGSEASLAFELNTDLFEGLIGAPPQAFVPALEVNRSLYSVRPTFWSTETADTTATTTTTASPTESEVDPNDVGEPRKHPLSSVLSVLKSSQGRRSSIAPLSTISQPLLPRLSSSISEAINTSIASLSNLSISLPPTLQEQVDKSGLRDLTKQVRQVLSTELTPETLPSLLVGTVLGAAVVGLGIALVSPSLGGRSSRDLDAY